MLPQHGSTDGLAQEFDRQAEQLLRKGYPEAAGLTEAVFMKHIAHLRARVDEIEAPGEDMEAGRLPFVIVVTPDLVAPDRTMSLVERAGKRGFAKMYPREPGDFHPVDGLLIPIAPAYLLVDIDRGRETINVTPNEALDKIHAAGRSPLTIDEGIAMLTHHPDFLQRNNCFSLLASRCGDQRVPAMWISGGAPRLGWCWAGNPHTWLGSASCRSRIGPP